MQSVEFTYIPSTEDLDFFADDISDTSLEFILTATDIVDGLTQRIAHRIQITNNSATDHSAKILTITGTDEEGKALTETINAPSTSTNVTTIGYFKTIENPTISATIGADTFDFGFVDEFVGAPYPVGTSFVKVTGAATVTGTINYDLEYTISQIFRNEKSSWNWHVDSDASGKTADFAQDFSKSCYALRFKANSYSAGAVAKFEILQAYR